MARVNSKQSVRELGSSVTDCACPSAVVPFNEGIFIPEREEREREREQDVRGGLATSPQQRDEQGESVSQELVPHRELQTLRPV